MTEQVPVEGTPATPTPATEGSPAVPATERSAAEVEAEYKARLSGKDRAHAAEAAELRRQLEAAQATGTAKATEAGAASDEVTELRRQLQASEQTNQRQQADYSAQTRAVKYPQAAEALDAQTLATMDEGKLAGLNARLTPTSPPVRVDPNTPAGAVVVPKPTSEKSSKELKADLARQGAAFSEQLRQRQ